MSWKKSVQQCRIKSQFAPTVIHGKSWRHKYREDRAADKMLEAFFVTSLALFHFSQNAAYNCQRPPGVKNAVFSSANGIFVFKMGHHSQGLRICLRVDFTLCLCVEQDFLKLASLSTVTCNDSSVLARKRASHPNIQLLSEGAAGTGSSKSSPWLFNF